MKKNIDEYYLHLEGKDIESLYDDVYHIVKNEEPNLNVEQIKNSISSRDDLGDGLVNDSSLIIHVINKKVNNNCVIYCYLKNKVFWQSEFSELKANLSRVMLIIINPDLKGGQADNIDNFFNGKKLNSVELLVMR
jgi:mannitol/fructose-specific phosphotransferase system IIA component (Ntr-type)